MADNNFDKKKLIEALRTQGVSDKEIEKLVGGPISKPQPIPNSQKNKAHQQKNAWKYDNKHVRQVREEDKNPDYEPIAELQKKQQAKKSQKGKPKVTRKKPKPKPRPKVWTKTEEDRLKSLWEAGYSVKELATEFGVSEDSITGKVSRLKASGWKAQVGTTHAPLPGSTPGPAPKKSKMGPEMKKFLADSLETNFGAAGRYFARKWGLVEKKEFSGKSGGKEDATAAVIKGNQEIIASLVKLDTALRRATADLTKSLAMATGKISEAINNTVNLLQKNEIRTNIEGEGPGGKIVPGSGLTGGGGSTLGGIAAVVGGVGLASLLMNRGAHASISYNDYIPPDSGTSVDSEQQLREKGAPGPSGDQQNVIIKVKELTFDAKDIIFDADDYEFDSKISIVGGGGQQTSSGNKSNTPTSGGTMNSFLDWMRGGPGGSGFFHNLADKIFGTGGGDHKGGYGGSPLKSKNAGSKVSAPPPGSFADRWSGLNQGSQSQNLADQRKRFAQELKDNPNLMEQAAAMAAAEEGTGASSAKERQAVVETMMNRASAHNQSFADTVGNRNYYAPYNNGAFEKMLQYVRSHPEFLKQFRDETMHSVLGGSNVSNYATQNGSADVAASARRTQSVGWDAPNGEVFSRKDRSEFSNIHGAGTTEAEGSWYERTKAADDAARQNAHRLTTEQLKAAASNPDLSNYGESSRLQDLNDRAYGLPTGGMDSQFGVNQGNRDVGSMRHSWVDSLQPQDLSGPTLGNHQKDLDEQDKGQDRLYIAPQKSEKHDAYNMVDRDSFKTSLLETTGPNHFLNYPGFENDSNSYGVV